MISCRGCADTLSVAYQKHSRHFILVKMMETRVYLIMNYVKVGLDLLGDFSICPELYFQNATSGKSDCSYMFRLIYNIAIAPCVLS